MAAYYNEIEPYAAQWLRNLIEAGHIAHGIVDERSIEDVTPGDLRGFKQCHFFAGIGVWSYALRQAGWPDDRPVWTGSCPCQPFSAAGKGAGFTDERHLWPAFHHLIQQCRPSIVVGEQVASKDAEPWIDLVQADVEALGYAFGAVSFPSASVGAPHIRDRLYWVADAESNGYKRPRKFCQSSGRDGVAHGGTACRVGNTRQNHDATQDQAPSSWQSQADRLTDKSCGSSVSPRGLGLADSNRCEPGRTATASMGHGDSVDSTGCDGRLAHAVMQQRPGGQPAVGDVDDASGRNEGSATTAGLCGDLRTGPVNGFWRDADWLLCRDGKWRPVEPGLKPLVASTSKGVGRVCADWRTPAGEDGFGYRAGRLKGYGNAINAQAAQVFIESVMEHSHEQRRPQ